MSSFGRSRTLDQNRLDVAKISPSGRWRERKVLAVVDWLRACGPGGASLKKEEKICGASPNPNPLLDFSLDPPDSCKA